MTDPNADVIKGYRFHATLQLRTPLRVLQHHGEIPAMVRKWVGRYTPVPMGGI